FRIIVEWEYYALLNLLKTKNFVPDIAWMSERLGISLLRCQEVWNDLIAAKMVVPDENGVFKRAYSRLATTDYELSLPLQQAHVEELKLVAEKIGQVPPELRDVFSLILPSRPQLLKKARQITRDYFRKMEALLESEPGEEVYLLGAHLIPLTLPKKESNQ
ncbi:MAG: DUF4423 domain-containing protein, partial [Bdellovibrionales bacterium]|nr:DUF4423 domain-containing protein [Bdellovibrionales bacterium]